MLMKKTLIIALAAFSCVGTFSAFADTINITYDQNKHLSCLEKVDGSAYHACSGDYWNNTGYGSATIKVPHDLNDAIDFHLTYDNDQHWCNIGWDGAKAISHKYFADYGPTSGEQINCNGHIEPHSIYQLADGQDYSIKNVVSK